MFGPKLKLSPELLKKLTVAAEIVGAKDVEEFALNVLAEKAEQVIAGTAKKDVSAEEVDDITKKLHGLGYIE